MEQLTTYTTRKAAVVGAKRALIKAGVESPLSDVHFIIKSEFTDEPTSGPFYWVRIDLATGLPEGQEPPVAPPSPPAPAACEPAPAASQALQQAIKQPTPPLTEKTPRWASPKSEPAGVKAYRPKAGTAQAAMYSLLSSPAGVDINHFCAEMNKTIKPGVIPWAPSNTWSALRYLLCAGRGYGLEFDGHLLRLVIPRVEVDTKPGS